MLDIPTSTACFDHYDSFFPLLLVVIAWDCLLSAASKFFEARARCPSSYFAFGLCYRPQSLHSATSFSPLDVDRPRTDLKNDLLFDRCCLLQGITHLNQPNPDKPKGVQGPRYNTKETRASPNLKVLRTPLNATTRARCLSRVLELIRVCSLSNDLES